MNMDVVYLKGAEAAAIEQRDKDPVYYGAKYFEIFSTFRNLLENMKLPEPDDSNSSGTSAAVEATATEMADYIKAVCREDPKPASDHRNYADACWQVIMTMVPGIPLGHPWYAVLVRTVHVLRGMVGVRISSDPDSTETWDGLGRWGYLLWGAWERRDAYLKKDAEMYLWKRWVSFFPQMPDIIATPDRAVRVIRDLETPPDEDLMHVMCVLWTACEWLIHKAPQALGCLRWLDSYKKGLRQGRPPPKYARGLSDLERWGWWKNHLQWWHNLLPDADPIEMKAQVARALAGMEAAET
ncbi:hypothetical protein QBC34DRAFT_494351 [Podospora aff. communis PSN243]|uniref:Uncharacterized protein n=1 Tax=Podospora aff. communis PSN243 TaxID=3040156 RepID=A0AAV9GM46_9PEZI|nr:hypothetical protein QBC34DRAFT_494351 [Podospora aff. communis PSN243]